MGAKWDKPKKYEKKNSSNKKGENVSEYKIITSNFNFCFNLFCII